jgi:AcrR family transcriptional regulator
MPLAKLLISPPSAEVVRMDGRRLRTAESRRRVIAALLECVRDGDFDPSAEVVAARAGVGLRTVFRLFVDKEGLFREMSAAVRSRMATLALAPLKGQTWRERLDDMIKRRFIAFEEAMPFRRAALAHAHYSKVISANNKAIQAALRHTLAEVLPPEVTADSPTFEAIDMALCIDMWIRLRTDQDLKPAQAKATVNRVIGALLSQAPA